TILGTVAYLILLERKIASWVQDRIGPNRVGPFGLFQPLADGLKFILKEDYRPKDVDKILFTVAPGVMILVVIISIAVIPWGGVHRATRMTELRQDESPQHAARRVMPSNATMVGEPQVITAMAERTDYGYEVAAPRPQVSVTYDYPFQIASLNIGVLFILAVLSLAVYGIVIGGWASNNKYSFLGGLRAAAQMISYEIPLGLSVLCIIVMYGTLDLGELVDKQAHYWIGFIPAWNVFSQPLAFLMFLVCIHAEANRAPFDLAEAEQELVGGYHTEYSAMRFALFFLAEYAGMITTSAVCVALFFGGWHFPGLTGNVDPSHPAITTSLGMCLLRCLVFFVKVIAIIFIFMWVRWSLPRFRFDQLMMLAWRALIPISLALLTFTALAVYFFGANPARAPLMLVDGKFALALLIGNIILLAVIMFVSTLLPAPPLTNRRVRILNSRFDRTPLPAIP
ncbi:MAG TPA: NADH-quinone oxidoreductase subunit NuoH, partial [Tepidisphaeraceae bacterium]